MARVLLGERPFEFLEKGVAFDDALDAFASSRTYELLFDFSSRQWAEGPDNLRFVWEQEKKNG